MTQYAATRVLLVRWRWCLRGGAAAAFMLLIILFFLPQYQKPRVIPVHHTHPDANPTLSSSPPVLGAGNSTLGFEAIFALSPYQSWRTTGLRAAANLTGLEIQIPTQPPIHPEIVHAFAGIGPEDAFHPEYSSVVAWLAHLDLIKHVVQSGVETALIVEDDMDWDISIKEQIVAVAGAVRQLTKTSDKLKDTVPFGSSWDVLWLGHCAEEWWPHVETIYIEDSTACPAHRYVGSARDSVDRLPAAQRVVFHSSHPICTFAYALSREGAKKVLMDVGAGKDVAFDIALMNGCKDRDLNCISVLPEVFRQYDPAEGRGSIVNGAGEEGKVETTMGHTGNILESARCYALWDKPCL